ncbi:MAG: hypothetical protein MUC56_14055 [Thermoanaerobaculales bacterium]|jgi:hypothetical protein|nr:hypothetical protein [Thermoanaerobaculales bacterium]
MLEPTRPARAEARLKTSGAERRTTPPRVEGLVQHKTNLERALAETREALDTGAIGKAVDERLRDLIRDQIERPETGVPGSVVARVVGHRSGGRQARKDAVTVPLPGMDAALRLSGETVATDRTDSSGVVTLAIPEDAKGAYEVVVLAPDCTVVACHKGRLAGSREPTVLLTVPYRAALAPAFDRGQVWRRAEDEARLRAAELKKKAKRALTTQRDAIEKAIAELDHLMTCR